MGSDLYMEAQSWRARPTKVYWKDGVLFVEKDHFYDGYKVIWSGDPKGKEDVLKAFGVKIPAEPAISGDLTELATALHNVQCRWNHTDGCSWYYEEDEWKKPGHGWAADMWKPGTMRAHASWLEKAKKIHANLPDIPTKDIAKIIEVVK
jgi:hypothetical protein